MKVLVINGPNLNMLGIRQPEIYGQNSYQQLEQFIRNEAAALGMEVRIFQSNHEGSIIDEVQAAYGREDAIIINPGGYTHTSEALADAVAAVALPTVEVHLTDPDSREDFRRVSYIRPYCLATFKGAGFDGYRQALQLLAELK